MCPDLELEECTSETGEEIKYLDRQNSKDLWQNVQLDALAVCRQNVSLLGCLPLALKSVFVM